MGQSINQQQAQLVHVEQAVHGVAAVQQAAASNVIRTYSNKRYSYVQQNNTSFTDAVCVQTCVVYACTTWHTCDGDKKSSVKHASNYIVNSES